MYRLIRKVTDKKDPIYQDLLKDPFWNNYGIKPTHTYLVHTVMELPISDQIGIYEFHNTRGRKYTLIFPYIEMMVPKTLETFLKFFDIMWEKYNVKVRINDTVRTVEESMQVNNSNLNVIKGQSPTISPHNFGVQVDITPIVVYKDGKELWVNSKMKNHAVWRVLAEEQNKLGLRSGLDFQSYDDRVHYDHPYAYTIQVQYKTGATKNVERFKKLILENYPPVPYNPPYKGRRPTTPVDWL